MVESSVSRLTKLIFMRMNFQNNTKLGNQNFDDDADMALFNPTQNLQQIKDEIMTFFDIILQNL